MALAVLSYYPPLSYYLMEAAAPAGRRLRPRLQVAFTIIVLGAALSSYYLGARVFGRPAAVVVSVAYVYNPYFLADIWRRGAVTEALGAGGCSASVCRHPSGDDRDRLAVLRRGQPGRCADHFGAPAVHLPLCAVPGGVRDPGPGSDGSRPAWARAADPRRRRTHRRSSDLFLLAAGST